MSPAVMTNGISTDKWTPVGEKPKFGVGESFAEFSVLSVLNLNFLWYFFLLAISNFQHNIIGSRQLSLNVGDTVVIYEEFGEWFYGAKSKERSLSGIFPKNYVNVKG